MRYRKGTRMVAKRLNGSSLMRTTAHFKKVQFKSLEDAQKWFSSEWPMEPVSEAVQSSREDRSSGSQQTDGTTTEMAASESIPADAVSPAVCKKGN